LGSDGPAKLLETKRPPVPVETEPTRRERLSDDLFALGTLEPDEAVDIAPEIGGRIVAILFTDGQPVAKGAVMFRLAGDLLEAERQDTEARLRLAETNFARSQRLSNTGVAARQSLDEAQANLAVARSALDLLNARVAKLEIKAPKDLRRFNQLRAVTVSANLAPGFALGEAISTAEAAARECSAARPKSISPARPANTARPRAASSSSSRSPLPVPWWCCGPPAARSTSIPRSASSPLFASSPSTAS
jgi:multidrug efflux pump subunit AcrA (membrane-fusion protein)